LKCAEKGGEKISRGKKKPLKKEKIIFKKTTAGKISSDFGKEKG